MLKKVTKLEASDIDIILPTIDWFIDKINREESFHFLRVNHGMIDRYVNHFVINHPAIFKDFQNYLTTGNYDIIFNMMYKPEWFRGLHLENDDATYRAFKSFLRLFHGYKGVSDKLHIGVSLGNGLGPLWGRYPEWDELQAGRMRVLSYITHISPYSYYHSGCLKHFSVMGELPTLFDSLSDYNVVFVGPSHFRLFKERFNIPKFYHIETPTKGAIGMLDDIISKIKDINNSGKTMVFIANGHIGCTYVSDELLETNISIIDIGRSFDWEFRDVFESEPTMANDGWYLPNLINETQLIEHINNLRNG